MIFRTLSASLIGALCVGAASASPDSTADILGDTSWMNKTYEVMDKAEKAPPPAWLRAPTPSESNKKEAARFLEQAAKIADQSLTPNRHGQQPKKKPVPDKQIVVCITLSSEFDIKSTLEYLSSYKDDKEIRLALAGLPEGCRTFGCAIRKFHELGMGNDYPSVTLDPMVFRRHNVKVAPTMLYLKKGREIAKVEGIMNPEWIRNQVEKGTTGDLGVRGPVVDIEEKNLMDEIKDRLADVDTQKKVETAKDDYWAHKKFVDLPQATENATYIFTPMVKAKKDIRDVSGRVLVKAGQAENPLNRMTFTRAIIVYNPANPGEREAAKMLRHKFLLDHKVPIYVITRPLERSFSSVSDEQAAVGSRVYLLTEVLARRMNIKKTVTTVVAKGNRFVVREYDVRQITEKNAITHQPTRRKSEHNSRARLEERM